MGNGHSWEMARCPLNTGDCYIQVNFAEKIRQMKILGSYPVTVMYRVTAIYRAVIHRIDCILTLQVYVFYVVRLHISKIVINYMYKVIYMVLILPDKRQNRYKFLSSERKEKCL